MYASLRCLACDAPLPADEHYACPDCGGELDVRYDLPRLREDGAFHRSWRNPGASIAEAFGPLLPLREPQHAVSLGEGHTPLIRARRLADRLGLRTLYLKLEGCNPTGSFKDRQVAVGLSKALEWGRTRFATVSSGNVGNALSAYAARAGVEAHIWVSLATAEAKRRQIQVYGAQLFQLPAPVPGGRTDPYFAAFKGMGAYCRAHGLVPMISARPVNPYMVEGAKTIAYETAAALGRAPDVVFLPVGGGGLAGGMHKGFCELTALGLVSTPPAVRGAQRKTYFAPIDDMDAPQYRTGYYLPLDGHWAWQAITRSGGTLQRMEDDAIRAAQAVLAQEEGVFAEPQGAYAVAALLEAAEQGTLDRDALTVCVVTGLGLKDMAAAQQMIERHGGNRPARDVASLEASVAPEATEGAAQ